MSDKKSKGRQTGNLSKQLNSEQVHDKKQGSKNVSIHQEIRDTHAPPDDKPKKK